MAKAKAECKCSVCGKDFTVERSYGSRADADHFEAYAAENYTECPACYCARMEREREQKALAAIEAYGLPQIVGVSDKQVSYAEALRKRFLGQPNHIADVKRTLESIDMDQLSAAADKMGLTPDAYMRKAFNARRRGAEYIVLTSGGAHDLIEAINNRC